MHEPPVQPEPSEADRDAATLSRLVAGDPDGLRHLLRDHGGLIRARLRRDFGNALDESEIEEAMSAMVMKVWNAAARFDPAKGTLRAWALVIARNSALRVLEARRRARLKLGADLDDEILAPADIAIPQAEHRRVLDDLRTCIQKLPRLQRAILEADLAAGESAPAEELARRLQTTPNSIYVSRQKGRKTLRRLLAARGHHLDGDPGSPRAAQDRPPSAEQS